jgi:ABC-2 type transport system permease protein
MGAIITVALKDLRLLWRNKFGLFWVIMFPLMMALFFGAMFNMGGSEVGSLRIAYVSDNAPTAQSFLKEFRKSDVLSIRETTLDTARELVAKGKLAAYVRYVASDSTGHGFMPFMKDSIEVGMDPSRKAESEYLRGLISQAYFVRMQGMFTNPKAFKPDIDKLVKGLDSASYLSSQQRNLLKGIYHNLDTFYTSMDTLDTTKVKEHSPFSNINLVFSDVTRTDHHPSSSWEITFPQSLLWALLGCAATFALSLVIERTRGTYLRLRLAPLSRFQILAGKGLACYIACVTVCSLLMILGALVFKIHVASVFLLALAIGCAAFCFVGIMMLISVLGRNEHTVGGAGWAILLVLSMIGGGMMPLMFMPGWIAGISNLSPMKWCALAFEGAIWRGFGFVDMVPSLGVLVLVGLAGMIVGTLVLAKYDR